MVSVFFSAQWFQSYVALSGFSVLNVVVKGLYDLGVLDFYIG